MDTAKKKEWMMYSVLFALLSLVVFLPFFKEDRSLLWNPDAVVYHIPMAEVFAESVKQMVKTGTPVLYDLSIGMGTDILAYISQWYMEPLNLLYAFFGAKKAEMLYEVLIFVRLYLVGVSFLFFADMLRESPIARVMGALVYVFSGYTLFTGTKAAPFLVAMILLPLIFYAAERIREGKRVALFVCLIAFSAVFSYYFLFMNSVLLAIYVLIAVMAERMEVRRALQYIGKLIGFYLTGLAIGGVTFLPAVAGFLGSSRSSGARNVESFLHYDTAYYQSLVTGLFQPQVMHDYWLVIGLPPLMLVAVLLLWTMKDKVSLRLKAAWIVLVCGVCIPLFGCLMNGGKVANNRWLYALILVGALTVCKTFSSVVHGAGKLFGNGAEKRAELLWCALLVLSLGIGGYALFAESGEGFAGEFHKDGRAYKIMKDNSNIKSAGIEDAALYRVDNTSTPKTASSAWVIKDYRGLVTNASGYSREMADFYRYFENAGVITSFRLSGMDNASILTTLAGVKYYTAEKGQEKRIPYGYEWLKGNIYKNKYAVPFSYSYDAFVARSKTEKLSPVQKQETLLQAAIVSDETAEELEKKGLKQMEVQDLMLGSKQLDYEIIWGEDVEACADGTQITAKKEEAGFDMVIRDIPGAGEVYVEWSGLSILSGDIHAATIAMEEDGARVSGISFQKKEATYSSGNDTYAANIGYADAKERVLHLYFTQAATYQVEDIKVYYLPIDCYGENLSERTKDTLTITKWSDTQIEATACIADKKLMCLPLIYSRGWHVFVDGKEQTLYNLNLMYCGFVLEEGEREIRLEYETPFLKTGMIVSLIGLIAFAGILILSRGKKKGIENG